MGEHSFRTRSCWCDSARAQGLQKQTWRWYSDHFVLNARSIVAIFLRNWTQCVDGFSLLWQRYVRKGNAAKNPAILGFFQSRSQRPRSFWLATGIATSGQVQLRKSALHGLPVTLRMLRVKSDKSDWFWSQSIVFTNPFKTSRFLVLTKRSAASGDDNVQRWYPQAFGHYPYDFIGYRIGVVTPQTIWWSLVTSRLWLLILT